MWAGGAAALGDGPWRGPGGPQPLRMVLGVPAAGTRSLRWGQGRGGPGNWGRTLLLTEQSRLGKLPQHAHPWASARSLRFTGPRGPRDPPAVPAPPAGVSRAGRPGDP